MREEVRRGKFSALAEREVLRDVSARIALHPSRLKDEPKQLNPVDLEGEAKDELTAKVLQMAADSVTLEMLKGLLAPNKSNAAPVQGEAAKTLGRKSKPGFTLSKKEIKSMPEKYRKIFACEDRIIPYRFHKGVSEAHYRRDGFKVFACAKNFDEMRKKFISKLLEQMNGETPLPASPKRRETAASVHSNARFADYLHEWLEIKRKTCKESTCKEYERLCATNLLPAFGELPIANITRQALQQYLFQFIDEGKHRTAEKMHQILCCIFDLAYEDLHILSPMKKIVLPYHEPKKGSALTREEEKKLVDFCIEHKDNEAASALLVLLYFGLRRSELKTISVENEMLTCITSKTKMGRSEVKRSIPFTPVFKRVLPYVDFEKAKHTNVNTIYTTFKRLLPNHHTHELRYNFITRAKEAGCNLEAVMLWAGHSFDRDVKTSAVDRGYTDYSDEYLYNEAQKIHYEL